MIETVTLIVGIASSVVALVSSVFYFRRARAAEIKGAELEVKGKEIGTASEMIDLVVKANQNVLQLKERDNELKDSIIESCEKENGETRTLIGELFKQIEKAIEAISRCPYNVDCPAISELRLPKTAHTAGKRQGTRQRNGSSNTEGHDNSDAGRQCDAPGAA